MPKFGLCQNSIFLRQIQLQGWDQGVLSEQKALVLGMGGLGCAVAMDVSRLGFGELHVLDNNIVETHSLNRECLYTTEDIKKQKPAAATGELFRGHAVQTVVYPHYINAPRRWDKICSLIDACTVVVQCIDYGDYFDAAVASYCLKRQIPMIIGGTEPTYGHMMKIFFQHPKKACYLCCHDLGNNEIISTIHPNMVRSYKDISFLPKDNKPVGGSTIYTSGTCGHLMVNALVQYLLGNDVPTVTLFNLLTLDLEKWTVNQVPGCMFCTELEYINLDKDEIDNETVEETSDALLM